MRPKFVGCLFWPPHSSLNYRLSLCSTTLQSRVLSVIETIDLTTVDLEEHPHALDSLVLQASRMTRLQKLTIQRVPEKLRDSMRGLLSAVGSRLRTFAAKSGGLNFKTEMPPDYTHLDFLNPSALESLELCSVNLRDMSALRRLSEDRVVFSRLRVLKLTSSGISVLLPALCGTTGALEILALRLEESAYDFDEPLRHGLLELSSKNPCLKEIHVSGISATKLLGLGDTYRAALEYLPALCAVECRKLFPSLPSHLSLTVDGLPVVCHAAARSRTAQSSISLADHPELTFEERAKIISSSREIKDHRSNLRPSLSLCVAKLRRLVENWRSQRTIGTVCDSPSFSPLVLGYFAEAAVNLLHFKRSAAVIASGTDPEALELAADLTADLLQDAGRRNRIGQDCLFVEAAPGKPSRWEHVRRLAASPVLCPKPVFDLLMCQMFDNSPTSELVAGLLRSPFFDETLVHPLRLEKGPLMTHLLLCISQDSDAHCKEAPDAILTLLQLHKKNRASLGRATSRQIIGLFRFSSVAPERWADAVASLISELYNCAHLNTEFAAHQLVQSTGTFAIFRSLIHRCYAPRGGDLPAEVSEKYAANIWRSICHIQSRNPSKLLGIACEQVKSATMKTTIEEEQELFASAIPHVCAGLISSKSEKSDSLGILRAFVSRFPLRFTASADLFHKEKEQLVTVALSMFITEKSNNAVIPFFTKELFPLVDLRRLVGRLPIDDLVSHLCACVRLSREAIWHLLVDSTSFNQLSDLIAKLDALGSSYERCSKRCTARLRTEARLK